MSHEQLIPYLCLRASRRWKEIFEVFNESSSHFLCIFDFLTVFSVCGPWHCGQSTAMLVSFLGGSSALSHHFTLGVPQ